MNFLLIILVSFYFVQFSFCQYLSQWEKNCDVLYIRNQQLCRQKDYDSCPPPSSKKCLSFDVSSLITSIPCYKFYNCKVIKNNKIITFINTLFAVAKSSNCEAWPVTYFEATDNNYHFEAKTGAHKATRNLDYKATFVHDFEVDFEADRDNYRVGYDYH